MKITSFLRSKKITKFLNNDVCMIFSITMLKKSHREGVKLKKNLAWFRGKGSLLQEEYWGELEFVYLL